MTVGNAATGESCAVPSHIADLIRQVLASLAAGHQVTISENLTELTPNEQQRARQRVAIDDLYTIDRELGLVDGPPPPKEAFKSGGRGA